MPVMQESGSTKTRYRACVLYGPGLSNAREALRAQKHCGDAPTFIRRLGTLDTAVGSSNLPRSTLAPIDSLPRCPPVTWPQADLLHPVGPCRGRRTPVTRRAESTGRGAAIRR